MKSPGGSSWFERAAARLASLLIPVLSCLAGPAPAIAASGSHGLVDRLSAIEAEYSSLCPAADDPTIDLAAVMKSMIDKLPSAGLDAAGPDVRVEALNRLLFTQFGIKASQDLNDPCNLFPSRVLERKQGYCLGIAALYLVIAERFAVPLHAVATPSHVFVRYDDVAARINVETLQGGASVADAQYVREQRIPEESIHRGVFMRNLTADEFLAQVHNNLGVIYSGRKAYEKAANEYETALDLDPRLPAAYYNYGNDLLRMGKYRGAVRQFSRSLRLYRTDVWALNNRGLAYLKMGRLQEARRDFHEALRIDPGFEQARRNLDGIRPPP